VEFGFGETTRALGIRAWDYRDRIPAGWTYEGIITWYPSIVAAWFVFCGLIEWLDRGLRRGWVLEGPIARPAGDAVGSV
jgi:hypothetical protein